MSHCPTLKGSKPALISSCGVSQNQAPASCTGRPPAGPPSPCQFRPHWDTTRLPPSLFLVRQTPLGLPLRAWDSPGISPRLHFLLAKVRALVGTWQLQLTASDINSHQQCTQEIDLQKRPPRFLANERDQSDSHSHEIPVTALPGWEQRECSLSFLSFG